jgi:hypothetical protein
MAQRRRSPAVHAARRRAVVLAAVAYLLATVGFPLPARLAPSACGCDPATKHARACCCCTPPAGGAASCCSGAKAGASADRAGVRWVLGLQEQRCRGLTSTWQGVGPTLPPPPRVTLPAEGPPAPFAPALQCRLSSTSHPPQAPPPRACPAENGFCRPTGPAPGGPGPCLNRRDFGA